MLARASKGNHERGRLVILSHNPLVPALVPDDVLDRVRPPARNIENPGPLTVGTSQSDRAWHTTQGLGKLVMQIAHVCNLACPYCISDAGRWGKSNHASAPYMSATAAAEVVHFFASRYGSIDTIYLFGGEPTLNLSAIRAVCDTCERLVAEGALSAMPDIGLTTNGINFSSEFAKLLSQKEYLKVSVSLDGPAHVHDQSRIDVRGRGTYDRIVKNITSLRRRTGRPGSLEITYNPVHLSSGLSLWETMQAIHADTGVPVVSVEVAYNHGYSGQNFDPLITDFDRTISEVVDAITRSMESMATTTNPTYYYHALAFMQVLHKPHMPNFCPAARNYFSVAKDGTIYPCQNLPQDAQTRIGRIGEPDLDRKLRDSPVLRVIDEANRRANNQIGDEWFANFCKVCPAYNFGETKRLDTLAQTRIKLYEAMASAFLTQLLRVSRDEVAFARLLDNVAGAEGDTFEINVF